LVPEDDNDDGGQRKRRDFRKDLFLESDSDAAYASIDDEEEQPSFQDESPEDLEQPAIPKQAKPFSLSYSHEATSSDEESIEPGCGSAVSESFSTWTTWDKTKTASSETSLEPKMSRKKSRKRRSVETPTIGHDDDALSTHNNATTDTFLPETKIQATCEDSRALHPQLPLSELLETSSLLPPATPPVLVPPQLSI
jgi:hypothetical protein